MLTTVLTSNKLVQESLQFGPQMLVDLHREGSQLLHFARELSLITEFHDGIRRIYMKLRQKVLKNEEIDIFIV